MAPMTHTLNKTIEKALTLDYWLHMPEAASETEKWPLMLFLHGAGERGDMQLVKKHGPMKRIDAGHDYKFIVAAPLCPLDTTWELLVDELMALLDEISTNYPVDQKRVYLTGLSMGGFGSWNLARLHPERFAAVAPICGGMPWLVDKTRAAQTLKTMPIWAFHGAKDPVVSVEMTREMVKVLMEAGGNVNYTEYPDLLHDSWTVTYDNPELYEWFLQQEKSDAG